MVDLFYALILSVELDNQLMDINLILCVPALLLVSFVLQNVIHLTLILNVTCRVVPSGRDNETFPSFTRVLS